MLLATLMSYASGNNIATLMPLVLHFFLSLCSAANFELHPLGHGVLKGELSTRFVWPPNRNFHDPVMGSPYLTGFQQMEESRMQVM